MFIIMVNICMGVFVLKKLLILFALVSLLVACGGKESSVNKDEASSYELTNKKHSDSGQTYLTIKVDSNDIDAAKQIVEGIVENPYDATGFDSSRASIESLFIQVQNKDSAVWLNAKVALTQKGIAQTGLEKVNAIEFKEN